MKKLYSASAIAILFFIATFSVNAQAWQWAKSAGGTTSDDVTAVTRDPGINGNVFITGYFTSPTITFDGITLNKSGSNTNMLIAKYDCNIVVVPQSAAICNGDSIFLQNTYQTSSGIYFDTLLASSGCDSIIQTTLSVNFFSTYDSLLICGNDSAFLQGAYQTSSGNYYDTLTAISGCDSILVTYLTINSVPIYDTTYITVIDTNYVTVYDSISVTDTLFIDVITGLIAPNDVTAIKVFPNPAKTQVTIEIGNFTLLNNYKISIENSLAQQVFFSLINQQQFVIDLSDWTSNGTYFVKIMDGQNTILDVRKIILQ